MKIVLSAVVALLLIGCSDNSGTEKKEELVKKEVVSEAKEAQVEEKKIVFKTVVREKETPKKIEKTDVAKKEVLEKKVAPKKVTKILKEKTKPASIVASIDGEKIFKKCATCHGAHGENKALNKSAVIKGWSSEKVITAINGYKDGTYGNSMKGVMKPQVANLSAAEVKAVADYISKL